MLPSKTEVASSLLRHGERDHYVDFVRGLCALSVVFIHTVFWSGTSYVPEYIRNLSLMFDVPVFFYLAGCSFSIVGLKKGGALKQVSKLMLYFFLLVLGFQLIFWNWNLDLLVQPLFLSGAFVPEFPVINGSYWFVPVYCVAVIVSEILLKYSPKVGNVFLGLAFLYYVLLWFGYPCPEGYVFGQPIQMLIFYVSLVLLGAKFYMTKLSKLFLCIVSIILFALFALLIMDIAIKSGSFIMQGYKFPVQLPYVLGSLLTIVFVMLFKTKIAPRGRVVSTICFIGKNAIFMFMSQGVSSSLIYKIVSEIHFHWLPKLLLMYVVNCFLAIVIAGLFYMLDKKIQNQFQKLSDMKFKSV